LEWKSLVYIMAIWYALRPFGVFSRQLVIFWVFGIFSSFWYIIHHFGIFFIILVYFSSFWYIIHHFGIFFIILVYYSSFWYIVPRKILQLWSRYICRTNFWTSIHSNRGRLISFFEKTEI
jgi:hypothetical protein